MGDPRIDELKTLLPQCLLYDWVRIGSRLVRLIRDKRHADVHDALLERLLQRARQSAALRAERQAHVPAITYPGNLPISQARDAIVAAIRERQVVIVAGETGSGKTTQIPKMCLEAGLGIEAKIGCTQPRRIAAMSISRRIAEELGVPWGREVGCKIRFDDRSSPETYIKLMTDGILLAETQGDPLLSEYNALIIDEAHERSLNIDFLLGYLKGLLAKRKDLKLIVSSATIDTASFSRAFDDAPIIEVSGRLFPVEVVYAPFDAESEDRGDITYIEAAAAAVERVMYEPGDGDVLVFMPGEGDIRETSDLLANRCGDDAEIVPLYGRLSAGDQQRVFAPSNRRKVVIATNIAETSLTIPGIRYVVDAGLARISRYNPRTRIKRLPVEPISQSSANQRKGRSGRVQAGVCIRLYSEEDFASRPAFTQPEIQRANLAEVILRMKAFHLGDIETFPFLNPPSPAAIQTGYTLLHELGALDEKRDLTPLGQELARLPIDPTLGRMLLQSRQERTSRELLVIASGLSIQDPRERPMDQRDAADAAHKRFLDPASDFLSLLRLWDAVHDQWEKLRTQSQRRKFCRANFLSYTRMREWQELHAQLLDALQEREQLPPDRAAESYDAIHRSILAGLPSHLALRTERNQYKASGNKALSVFPGSVLFERNAKPNQSRNAGPGRQPQQRKPAPSSQPEWMVAAEFVETSQLFARTLAGIDPLWVLDVAPHLCKKTYQNPHWSASAGRVLVTEKIAIGGLELHQRKVIHANVNPTEATTIFIRSALVEEDLLPPHPQPRHVPDESSARGTRELLDAADDDQEDVLRQRFPFLLHNRSVRQKIENWRTRVRRHDLVDADQALFDFYSTRITNISSVAELERFLRNTGADASLRATEADLTGGTNLEYDRDAFPDSVQLAGRRVPLSYAYAPGEEHDGVTLKLPADLAHAVTHASLDWAVPGLRASQAAELLRALPKSIRRDLMPLPPKAEEIARDFRPSGPSLLQDLALFLRRQYGIAVAAESWPPEALPQHLRPRIEVVDAKLRPLATGRDLDQLRVQLREEKKPVDDADWNKAAAAWDRPGLSSWTFGTLPEKVTLRLGSSESQDAWPGLAPDPDSKSVSLRLFRTPDAAQRSTIAGVGRLMELAAEKDLAWVQRDLAQSVEKVVPLLNGFTTKDAFVESAWKHLRRHLLPSAAWPHWTEAQFNDEVVRLRAATRGLVPVFMDKLEPILKARQEVLTRCGSAPTPSSQTPKSRPATSPSSTVVFSSFAALSLAAPAPAAKAAAATTAGGAPTPTPGGWRQHLDALLPPTFLESTEHARLAHLPRYLKALATRIDRAKLNPAKESERAALVAPYLEARRAAAARTAHSPEAAELRASFHWMVEEYKVSVFAQELGTAQPISPKRLDEHLERLRAVLA